MSKKVAIFDSSLRDGAQAEGISFSVEDKLKILELLDGHGIDYIEAGNPGSNPKDLEFFARARAITLKHAKLAAFGSTRRRDIKVEQDSNVQSLLLADTPAIVIFGKSWDFHVTDIIRTTLEENLAMISETLAFFKAQGKEVVYDAEHFFDGYKHNPAYAVKTLQAAVDGGADALVLCDTNGGTFPSEIANIVGKISSLFPVTIGIHAHNDAGMAVANSVAAVENGARHVQGTYIGFGERCGNANLCSIIPNICLKMNLPCLSPDNLTKLRAVGATASAILVNPEDAEKIDLMTDVNKRFMGNGPFGIGPTTVWGRPLVECDQIEAGKAIVGYRDDAGRLRALAGETIALNGLFGQTVADDGHGDVLVFVAPRGVNGNHFAQQRGRSRHGNA